MSLTTEVTAGIRRGGVINDHGTLNAERRQRTMPGDIATGFDLSEKSLTNAADRRTLITRPRIRCGRDRLCPVWRIVDRFHGHARATEDIDILLREGSLSEAIKAAASAGFTFETGWLKFRDGTPEEQKLFRVFKPHSSGSLILNLLIVTPTLQPVWNQRQQFKRGDRSLSVVSSNGLIDMKRLSGRQRDLSDIERLTGAGDD
ncbi:MAG: hypothetical protein ACYTGL_09185 [Planctomycetota bacterium]